MKNEIVFASATRRYEEILFDVKLQGVYSDFKLPSSKLVQSIEAHNHRAVVNQSNGDIIYVVGKDYKLISNKEAVEMGKQIFTQLYPQVKTNELIPFKVVAPFSKASAHIDLIHESVNFNVWDQETWLPFLRTTNSYNKTFALSFEIGFVRKLCSNGVLFNKKSLKLKYHHVNGNKIEVQNDAKQIKGVADEFTIQCERLRAFKVNRGNMFPLVCKILNINLDMPQRGLSRKVEILRNIREVTNVLTEKYFNSLGDNAYAAFNVVTDLVSHQDEYKNLTGYYFNVRSYYTRSTDWMIDFLSMISKDFSLADYLKSTIENIKKLGVNKSMSLFDTWDN